MCPSVSAHEALIEHLSAAGTRLLVLLSVGGPDALAEPLIQQPFADPMAPVGAALRTAASGMEGAAYPLGGQLFALVVPAAMGPGAVVAAARSALRDCGDALSDCGLYGEAAMPEEASNAEAAIRLAAGRLRGRRSWQEQAVGRQARGVLLRVLEERGLAGGIDRLSVAAHAVAVGRRIGLSLSELDDVIRAAELQDLGKIAVPEEILNKSGALSPEEWAVIRRHPLVGERILAGSPSLSAVARLVRSAYERWDGSGYPDGLVGEDIPLGARIIAVCVAFNAMTAARPYRAPMSPEEAVARLRIASGSQFDPVVVDTFYLEIEPTLVLPDFALVSYPDYPG